MDRRIAAVVPFNFGEAAPATARFVPVRNQWPPDLADPGLYDWDASRVIRRSISDQFLQWFICASVAPRRFVYSFEVGWQVEDLPAWSRYHKVYSFYKALDDLAEAHGFGLVPGPGEAWNVGRAARKTLDPTLERWFGLAIPFTEDRSVTNPNLAPQPDVDRRPVSELTVLTPEISSQLHRKTEHEIAREQGETELAAAREQLGRLSQGERRKWLQTKWASKLGNIEPNPHPEARIEWTKALPDANVEAISLRVERQLVIPLLLLRPTSTRSTRLPLVVAVSEAGKELFLKKRALQIETLLRGGTTVCLPDVRATGEMTPDSRRDPDSDESMKSNTVLMIGETLLGERLRDLRTVLAYLGSRQDLNTEAVALWGEGFNLANAENLILDEEPPWQIGPEIQWHAEPLGGLLALLGGLFNDNVREIAVCGGLLSLSSILDSNFAYVPQDVIVPDILEVADVPDVAAAFAPRPLLLEGMVDGLDRPVSPGDLEYQLQSVYKAYGRTSSSALSVQSFEDGSDVAQWFLNHAN